nr:uncharacterized protein LOC115259447 [Aedes albopictus]
MKINLHLKKLTKSPYVFLVPILHSSEEGLIQVINDNVLDKEIRFSINSTHLKNTSQQNGYPFVIDDLNKDFSEVIEMVVGNKYNTLIYDIKSPRVSKLQTQISTSSTSSTASFDGGSMATQQHCNSANCSNNGSSRSSNSLLQQQIALFVCIAGDNESRSRFQFYIDDTFRYVLGHLLTAFDLFEEKRVRYQCQNLLQVARRLLGKIGKSIESAHYRIKWVTACEQCA